jgi:hypothetical protein
MNLRPVITLLVSLGIGASPALVNALASTDPDAATRRRIAWGDR